jgi:hypothetical protein
MKLALFYPKNLLAGWYSMGGYVAALKRMGHEVLDCWLPGNTPNAVEQMKRERPSVDELNSCDLIMSMYHEYLTGWYEAIYGFEGWSKLEIPVVARFDESFDRPDLHLAHRWDELKRWAQRYSFPAQQDAEKYGGQWLPFSSDTFMFKKLDTPKKYDVGFVGSMYPIRVDYLERLKTTSMSGADKINFVCGPVGVQDVGGGREPESTQLLAENYRQMRIFFCLPPMSRLVVAKIADVMACGTFVMYPKLPHHARLNMNQFRHKEHIFYYNPGYLGENVKQMLYYLEREDEREKIAQAGCELVHKQYTLEQILTSIISLGMAELIPFHKVEATTA